jgi:hypothetical protein
MMIKEHWIDIIGISHKSYFFSMRCKKDHIPVPLIGGIPSFSAYGG